MPFNLFTFKAPTSVEIVGNLNAKEGEVISVICGYADNFPVGSQSVYVFENDFEFKEKVQTCNKEV